MTKTLVMFHGNLNTINLFTDQLCKGFEELGYEVFMFDLEQAVENLGSLYAMMQNGGFITAMIGINNAFFGLKTNSGVKVWEQLGIPCINILVDHPYWYRNILLNFPANGIVLCVDRNHMSFVNRFYPQIEINGFIAHGGVACASAMKKIRERDTDILYAGSLYADYAKLQKPDFSKWNFPAEQVCEETIQYLMKNRQDTIEDALEIILAAHRIVLSEDEFCDFISSCVYIERTVSSYFREKIIRTIARAGFSVSIYGAGWKDCEWISLPNVHYGGMIEPEDVLAKMEDAKIVLNTLPWFKDGAHERVFNAMLRGCVVVSETSHYLEEIMPEDSWCSFSLADEEIENLPIKVRSILEDDEYAQKIADKGYWFAQSAHTWRHRAGELHESILKYV